MKFKNNALVADLAFLFMLLLMFCCAFFLAGDTNNFALNCITLAVVLGVVILTYFTSLTVGLVCNLVLVFGYATAILFSAITQGGAIASYTYFWIVWSPAMTAACYLFSHQSSLLQQEAHTARTQLMQLSAIDPLTGLGNLRSFEQEAAVLMKISQRYHMDLVLLVWEFRFSRELEALAGSERMQRLVQEISQAITASLREEDAVFLLDSAPYTWGTLLLTNPESCPLVIERVEADIRKIEFRASKDKHDLYLDMRVGSAVFSKELATPLSFLEQAKRQVEFDVS